MATAAAQIKLRLPDGMRESVAALASANRRSMNAEIILMIEGALRRRASTGTPAAAAKTSEPPGASTPNGS